ncbi:hypothetical protein JCM3775_007314 [Rhodotorula graminis]|uniref:Dol-P-Glc:Glc(2)Man(9)GlcNAc(2)-PP-Dol alpha-1,2-glucosyltransferase n=1 Tax=Rhodotorula graminis (strain WP1) TaxID=578459 RepID=A0A0P9FBV2_RHOGW|nr:glycosyltransferase family 59 protein [Rhodotorula graminis WP1]KPV73118.1 glycosyltransferase family 59 protein [Rhodotorula graminis WP1]
MVTRRQLVAYAAWAASSTAVACFINRHAPEPYMDEIFHVPQAQAYCRGDWTYWDPALTTPPGLYLVPAALVYLQRLVRPVLPHALAAANPCSVAALRGLNLVLSLSLPFLYARLIRLVAASSSSSSSRSPTAARHRSTPSSFKTGLRAAAASHALVMALCPLLGWWAWLYYTDLAAVTIVLSSWSYALEERYVLSAIIGGASLLFRQTNVVWLVFIAGQAAIAQAKRVARPSEVVDPHLEGARPADLIRMPWMLARSALQHPTALVPVLGAYLPVFVLAAAFVVWNGGIVLGDKSNHVPTLHVPQLYYCVSFATVFFAPHLVGFMALGRAARTMCGTARRVVVTVAVLGSLCWSIKRYTIAHPFLLADNRHYAFYLWRRVINVHPLARYALAPGYLVAATLLWQGFARARTLTLSSFILLLGATVAVLLPTPLLEPRYFLVPMLVARLYLVPGTEPGPGSVATRDATVGEQVKHKRNHAALRRRRARSSSPPAPSPSTQRLALALEAALYLAVQATCVYLFVARPFRWEIALGSDGRGLEGRDEREVGRWQRFMW